MNGIGIVGADGWLLAQAGPGVATACADLDLTASRDKAQTPLVDTFGDRRPALYGAILAGAAVPPIAGG